MFTLHWSPSKPRQPQLHGIRATMSVLIASLRHLWVLAIFSSRLSFPLFVVGQSCPISPFAVQLRNCTFASGVEAWGNLVEIGSPPQRVCLIPSTVVNSTLVSQYSLCVKSSTLVMSQCESLRGGFFNENSSSTWTEAGPENYNDSRSNPTWDHFNAPGLTKVGFETLRFPGNDIVLYGAGVALNQFGNNSNAGMIGLGKDSVFLQDAVHQQMSPSKSWSLDSGSLSLVKPRNGELVVGGYNKARVDGSFRWSNISDMSGDRPCPLRTTIKDIKVQLPNGTTYPLKSSAEDITACIEPYDNLFRFTTGMLLNWKAITGFNQTLLRVYSEQTDQGLSFTELGLPYIDESALEWSLSITLDNGYSTTLPHYEIQKPLLGWNALGEKEAVPGMTNIAILDTPTGQGEVPTLGKIFLSRSILAVDYDANRFGLAEALTDPGISQLVPLSCGGKLNSTSNPTSTINSSSSSNSKTPIGVIIGSAVGGAAVFILAATLVWWILRRRKARREASAPPPIWGLDTNISSPKAQYQASHGGQRGPMSSGSQVNIQGLHREYSEHGSPYLQDQRQLHEFPG